MTGDPKDVLDELRRRVGENRQLGRYPVGLEEQLEADFKAIMDVVHGRQGSVPDWGGILHQLESQLEGMRSAGKKADPRDTLELLDGMIAVVRGVHDEVQMIREEDSRVLRKLNHLIMDRLVMVDVLAQAVVEIETTLRNQASGS